VNIVVFGAYGHTGRFVVRELIERGFAPIVAGRDLEKLRKLSRDHGGLQVRVADVTIPQTLDTALTGGTAVLNCAGPFLDTAAPIIEAAIRVGLHYLDIAAEQTAVLDVFERFGKDSRVANLVVAPAMGFYGALGDLLATAALDDWQSADEVRIAVALDSWRPTRGTRLTGDRNHGLRFILSNNKLERAQPPAGRDWSFLPPFGRQQVVPLSLAETILISRHLRTPDLHVFMNAAPLADLRNPNTPPPAAADDRGRSSQVFQMDVIAQRDGQTRRVVAEGRDIYATAAPIVVEATQRILGGSIRATGVVAAGEMFDARGFLRSLEAADIETKFL